MSASLVGSEMCIRDRLRGVFDRGGDYVMPLEGDAGGAGAGGPGGPAPVSYTHLTLPTICSV
eukprot:8850433-Alexandrium_andersonii.AAC.1